MTVTRRRASSRRVLRAGGLPAGCLLLLVALAAGSDAWGQQAPGGAPTARALAPIDLTGYWVSVITEDWRLRMITPPKGDYSGVPLNEVGVRLAETWDPDTDIANGNECKAYGAAGIMRMPTRIRITWVDDQTLRLDFDAGQQTRLVHFDAAHPPGPRSLQGDAVGEWIDMRLDPAIDRIVGLGGGRGADPVVPQNRPPLGALRVVTANLLPQYHRKNGSPASENTIVNETFDTIPGPAATEWLIVETVIEDPAYLRRPLVTSSHFKREPDDSNWSPTACEVEPPPTPRIPVPWQQP